LIKLFVKNAIKKFKCNTIDGLFKTKKKYIRCSNTSINKKILIKSNLIRYYDKNNMSLNYKGGKPNFKNFKKNILFFIK